MPDPAMKAFVTGHPIAHSRSPKIHNYWLKHYGLDGSYEAIDVAPADFAAFLAGHGIKARSEVLEGSEDSYRLVEFIAASHADLVVSGAYGHSRLREWAFGGVTRSLLDERGLNRFMSS